MRVVNRQDFTLDVKIKDMNSPSNMKAIHFIRNEYNTDENIILTNTYEFFLTKEDMKTLAKVLNDYE